MGRQLIPSLFFALVAMMSCAASMRPAPDRGLSDDLVVREGVAAGLSYLEVVPEDLPSGTRLPMVVWLHGRGDKPQVPDGPFLGLERAVRLVVFQAPEPYHRGFSWLPVSAAKGESRALVRGLRTRGKQLARAIKVLKERRPTRGAPVVMGFSQGAMLTMTLAVHHPEVVGSAFALSGWLPPSLQPRRRPHALHPKIFGMHGAQDDILPVERTRRAYSKLEKRGYQVQLREFSRAEHRMNAKMWRQLKAWVRHELRRRFDHGRDGQNLA